MIARFGIATSFVMVVPDATEFRLYQYEDSGYLVTLKPPTRSDVPLPGDVPETFRVNGTPGFAANAINIDFQKSTFDRTTGSAIDPPSEVIDRALSSFTTRLRYVTRGSMIRSMALNQRSWNLQYLADDGTELPETPGLIRGRGGIVKTFKFAAVDAEVWAKVHELPPNWEAPPWHDILLDASFALPMLGPAIVLAATSLEVFISTTLNALSKESDIKAPLWNWITKRGNWLKDPSVAEQYDFLLLHLTGHTLKENNDLWEAFRRLRKARNSFVHEGRIAVGDELLAELDVLHLIGKCHEIIALVTQWIPEHQRSPKVKLETKVESLFKLT